MNIKGYWIVPNLFFNRIHPYSVTIFSNSRAWFSVLVNIDTILVRSTPVLRFYLSKNIIVLLRDVGHPQCILWLFCDDTPPPGIF